MLSLTVRILTVLALTGTTAFRASAQSDATASAGPRVEPGLESAVRWIWRVEPSPAGLWGLELPPRPTPTPTMTFPPMSGVNGIPTTIPRASLAAPAPAANAYTVKRGDSLFVIGRRFKVPVPLLKEVNGLETDNIRAGQMLRIPSPEEVQARAPAPAPPAAARRPAAPAQKSPAQAELETLALQVFLDREGFSAGPIDGKDSPDFQKIAQLYRDTHDRAKDPAALRQIAQASGAPLSRYTLKFEDFRFIAPPRAARADAGGTPAPTRKSRKAATTATSQQAKPTYAELTSATMLAYRTPWEFAAERFHCDEAYLRHLNSQLRGVPAVGTELQVPNVIPFAIERALDEPLQPPANSRLPVTATVVDLSRLEIHRGGALVAAMPLSMARPGLRGRDPWIIRDAIPRPRLVTEQEPRVKPLAATRIFGREDPNATPPPVKPRVPVEQSLSAGPNNPAGILWINLSKSGSTELLPYGLHGTSIPEHMRTQESLGGLRLANWDIARAVRLLPQGATLEWKQSGPIAPPAAARPAL